MVNLDVQTFVRFVFAASVIRGVIVKLEINKVYNLGLSQNFRFYYVVIMAKRFTKTILVQFLLE